MNSGDSYTDTGFDINGVQPSSVDALGNPEYGTSIGPTCKVLSHPRKQNFPDRNLLQPKGLSAEDRISLIFLLPTTTIHWSCHTISLPAEPLSQIL